MFDVRVFFRSALDVRCAAIRAGLTRLIEEPGLREQLVRDGLRNVAEYSAESVAAQYAALYREVLGEESGVRTFGLSRGLR